MILDMANNIPDNHTVRVYVVFGYDHYEVDGYGHVIVSNNRHFRMGTDELKYNSYQGMSDIELYFQLRVVGRHPASGIFELQDNIVTCYINNKIIVMSNLRIIQ